GFTRATGVTLAIVRKARDIFWTTIGVLLIVRRGLSLRAAANQSEGIADDIGIETSEVPTLPVGGS
nr:hypothetical protein [Pyrinomonadaceae bacterium]